MWYQAVLLGGFFGAALYIAGAHLPSRITGMLQLRDFSLMKAILFGIGLSSFLIALTNTMGIFDVSHFKIKPMNLGVIIGGLVFGVGFGMGSTCPGTCVASLGSVDLWKKGVSAALGGLLGAYVFSKFYGTFDAMGLYKTLDLGKLTLFKVSEEFPSVMSVGTNGLYISGLLFMAAAYLLPDYRYGK